jgi:uncharacterized phage infection (PIP) family protein YhgE
MEEFIEKAVAQFRSLLVEELGNSVIVTREALEEIQDSLNSLKDDVETAQDEASTAETYINKVASAIEDAQSSANTAVERADEIQYLINQLL